MLLFFMLIQIRQETLASENPQSVYSLSNIMEQSFSIHYALSKIKVEYCVLPKVARQVTWL
jgi:hypothetical protein